MKLKHSQGWFAAGPEVAYSGDVNGVFQRDVNSRSGDVNKVGAKLRWDCNHA